MVDLHGLMARGIHGLPKVSLGSAMPYPSMPCGRSPLKWLCSCSRGGRQQGGRPLTPWDTVRVGPPDRGIDLQGTEEDVNLAVESAAAAYIGWSQLPGHVRARHLYSVARHVQKHQRLLR
jgi:hypothetical protein